MLLACAAFLFTGQVSAADTSLPPAHVATAHASADLTANLSTVSPGQPLQVLLTVTSIPHWHTYWKNPGDVGLPTRIRWTLPDGVQAGEIQWPLPSRLPTPPLMSFGYEGATPLLTTLTTPATLQGPLVLRASVRWLVCAEQCIPETAELALSLPVGPAQPSLQAAGIASVQGALPLPVRDWQVSAQRDAKWLRLEGTLPGGQPAPARLFLFPDQKGRIAPAAEQPYQHDGSHFMLAVPLAPAPVADGAADSALNGLLVSGAQGPSRQGWLIAVPVGVVSSVQVPVDNGAPVAYGDSGAAGAAAGSGGLALALLFAFLGGLLLNLMPCVLPVLSLKVFALIGDAGAPRARSTWHGVLFLAGVLISFWTLAGLLLALKAAGAAVGWGFQLQSPVFVALLATLFAGLTLNFAGVFELGTGVQGQAGQLEQAASSRGSQALGAFASGVLTTLVATPCTAPFLGAGIGYTLQQSAWQAVLVFTAMGLGVGLPVSLLAFFPQWLRRVPRPGAWMETLRQIFAFPMLLTVVWLSWVLGRQLGADAMAILLVGLTLITLAAWLYGRAQRDAVRGKGGRVSGALAALALAGAVALATQVAVFGDAPSATSAPANGAAGTAGEAGQGWAPYSDARLAALRAQGRPVFVDFTAAWCLSCQVNKRTSLRASAVTARMHELGVATLEADWTNSDPQITAALGRLQRNAVPVYAVYPKGGGAPVLLPEVLTPGIVIDALERAAHS